MQKGGKTHSQYTYVVGVDEAGRGPLAGPVAVCAVLARKHFDFKKHFPGLGDSKILTSTKREELYLRANHAVASGNLRYRVAFGSSMAIDRVGINATILDAVRRCLRVLSPAPGTTHTFLDGLLTAPPQYTQTTIIHGDALIPIISLASILAKVSRDRLMVELSSRYPEYGFERHKGYGTPAHYAALAAYGPSKIHRKSYLTD